MVQNLFDLSHDNFYGTLRITYADSTRLAVRPVAVVCEAWARSVLRVRQSPRGTVLPVFVHAPNSEVEFAEYTQSRSNREQLRVLLTTLDSMRAWVPSLRDGDIGIITPYKAQLRELLRVLPNSAGKNHPRKKFIASADSVQGSERTVVFILMVNTRTSGGGFLHDLNRLNVISSRASDFLVIIGDDGVGQRPVGPMAAMTDLCRHSPNGLRHWVDWFDRGGRIAVVERTTGRPIQTWNAAVHLRGAWQPHK